MIKPSATPLWAVSGGLSHPSPLLTSCSCCFLPFLALLFTWLSHVLTPQGGKQAPSAFPHPELPQMPSPGLLFLDEQSRFSIPLFSSKTQRCLLIDLDILEQGKVVLFKAHRSGLWEGKLLLCVPQRKHLSQIHCTNFISLRGSRIPVSPSGVASCPWQLLGKSVLI